MALEKMSLEKSTNLTICMVEDADTFLVREQPDEHSESYRQFILFQQQLNRTFHDKRQKRLSPNTYTPEEGQSVVVLRAGIWCRAVVKERIIIPGRPCSVVLVFLSDYGEHHRANVCDLFPLEPPGAFQSIPHQTKRVKLAGITPVSLDYTFEEDLTLALQDCLVWDIAAKRFVQRLKEATSKIEFECISHLPDGSFCGHVYLASNPCILKEIEAIRPFDEMQNLGQRLSLVDILVWCQFGVYSQSSVHKQTDVKGSSASELDERKSPHPLNMKRETCVIPSSSHSLVSSLCSSSTSLSNGNVANSAFDVGLRDPNLSPALQCPSENEHSFPQKYRGLASCLITDKRNPPPNPILFTSPSSSPVHFLTENFFLSQTQEEELPKKKEFISYLAANTPQNTDSLEIISKTGTGETSPQGSQSGRIKGILKARALSLKKSSLSESSLSPTSLENSSSTSIQDLKMSPTQPKDCQSLLTYNGVYSGGCSMLTKDQLICDERDMRTNFHHYVCDSLTQGDFFITRLQNHAWPAIVRALSCCLIGGKNAGKTYAFTVPLLSSILNHFSRRKKRHISRPEPVAIVVCCGWEKVEFVSNLMLQLFPPGVLRLIRVSGVLTDEAVKTLQIEFLKGLDILVTTLPCLLRLSGKTQSSWVESESVAQIKLERCSHLVFDDVDQLWNKYSDVIYNVLKDWQGDDSSNPIIKQCIFTSSIWFKELPNLVKMINYLQPNIIVSSHLEAAIAVKLQMVVHHVEGNGNPVQTAFKILQKSLEGKVVVFSYDEEALLLLSRLLSSIAAFITVVMASDLMWDLKRKVSDWKVASCSMILLVCDNPVNPILQHNVCSAKTIIHLGCSPTKQHFGNRLSSMSALYPANPIDSAADGTCHLILTDKNIMEHPYIVEELRRFGTKIPSNVFSAEREATEAVKKKRESKNLCHYIKAYGRCHVSQCDWRHFMIPKDGATALPSSGEVSFDILSVLSAARYFVRLTSFVSSTGKRIDLTRYYKIMFMKLQEALACSKSRVPVGVIEEGVLCAVHSPASFWARAKVIGVDFSTKKVIASLLLIDEGTHMSLTEEFLYKLPDSFQTMPPLTTEVYLCHIEPVDLDTSWNIDASDYVRDLLMSKRSIVYSGRIVLALGRTIWLSPLCGRKKVLGKTVIQPSLKSILLSHKFGTSNPNHMTSLRQLCCDAGLAIDDVPALDTEWLQHYDDALNLFNPSEWAFRISTPGGNDSPVESGNEMMPLKRKTPIRNGSTSDLPNQQLPYGEEERLNCGEMISVEVGEVISPLLFYVIKKEKLKRLQTLEDDIAAFIPTSLPEKPRCDEFCLAQFEDGRYYRGRASLIRDEDVLVFFIDYGETDAAPLDKVFPCPTSLLEALPPQAITCQLEYVSIPQDPSLRATKLMREIIESRLHWNVLVSDVHVTEKGTVYQVDLVDSSTSPYSSLRRKLLAASVVVERPEEEEAVAVDLYDSPENYLKTKESGGPTQHLEGNISDHKPSSVIQTKSPFSDGHKLDSLSQTRSPISDHKPSSVNQTKSPIFDHKLASFNQTRSSISLKVRDESFSDGECIEDAKRHYSDIAPDSPENNSSINESPSQIKFLPLTRENLERHLGSRRSEEKSVTESETTENERSNHVDSSRLESTFLNKDQVGELEKRLHVQSQEGQGEISINSRVNSIASKAKTQRLPPSKPPLRRPKSTSSTIPALEDSESSVTRHPHAYWKQDERRISLRLALPDVKTYECRFYSASVRFMTVVKEVWYAFDEALFGRLDTDLCYLQVLESAVVFTLEKENEEMWPRLLLAEGGAPWLHADFLDWAGSEMSSEKCSSSPVPWSTDTTPKEGGLPDGVAHTDSDDDTLSCLGSDTSSLKLR